MMIEPVVAIFPHSDNEFRTPEELCWFLRVTLPHKQKGRYLLGELGQLQGQL